MHDVLGAFVRVVNDRRHESCHELDRMIVFQISRLERDDRVGGGMTLIEGVICKIRHLIENLVGDLLGDAVCETARNIFLRISVDKVAALLLHNGRFFLGHRAAHEVGPAHAVSAEIADDLHDLFLIDNTAVCRLKDRANLLTFIRDSVRMLLTSDVLRNEIHRARAIQCNTGDNVFQRMRFQLLHERLHTGALKLEHALAAPLSDHFHDRRIVVVDFAEVERLIGTAVRIYGDENTLCRPIRYICA